MIDPTARVHPSADVEADVSIGPGTNVWHGANIRAGARLGAECRVGRAVFIDEGVVVGNRVKIHNAALIYSGASVEDGVFIGPGAILTNDRHPRAITTAGDLVRGDDLEIGPIVLRNGCSIGAGAVVVAGIEIGRYAMAGAGAVVTHSVPEYALVVGNPARRIGWVCACGARLLTSSGDPAPAVPDLYAQDPDLYCSSCERRYHYVADAEALVERPAIRKTTA